MKDELRHLRKHMDETVLKDIDFGEASKEKVRRAVRAQMQEEAPVRRPWLYQLKNVLGVAVCCLLLFAGVIYALNQQESPGTSAGNHSQSQGASKSGQGSARSTNLMSRAKSIPDHNVKKPSNAHTDMQKVSTYNPNAVHMVRIMGGGVGWKLTSSQVLRSVNSGKTWYPVTLDGKNLHFGKGAYFLNGNIGWVAGTDKKGNTEIFHTSDGGQQWTHTNLAKRGGTFDFITPTEGWILQTGKKGNAGAVIFHTTGGDSWRIVSETGRLGNLPKHGKITGLGFYSSTTGWATGFYPNTPGKVWLYRTDTGGTNWTPDPLKVPNNLTNDLFHTFPPMFFKNNYMLPVVAVNSKTGDKKIMFYQKQSIDSPWANPYSPLKVANRKLTYDFLSGSVGWVTDGVNVYKTQDGGQSWNVVHPGSHFQTVMKNGGKPKELDIASNQVARLVVTRNGGTVLLKTNDGGQSWVTVQ